MKKIKKIKKILYVVTALLFIFPPNLLAEAVGTITYIEGRVEKLEAGGKEYLPVLIGDNISRGDAIRTKGYSKAEIAFEDDSLVRLAETSQIRVKEYNIDEAGFRKSALIGLDRGRVRAIVSKKGRSDFSIETLNAFGTVKGSDIFMGYYNSATTALVVDGTLEVVNSAFLDQPVAIKEGSTASIPHNGPPRSPRIYIPAEKERYEAETGPAIRKAKELAEGLKVVQARVVRLSGAVMVMPSEAKSPHAPAVNEILNIGDTIVTGEDGQIEIVMDNGHILILKPNTQLILTILTRDPKSGVYENLFECRYGKLIAKLKKLEKDSRFEIKTPTAVCGVRGTIMYLDVLPMLTRAFYEGGSGYITSIISGITAVLNPGQTSGADDKGNVFDPTDTTDEEREGFGSLWGDEKSDDDEYGYSEPPDSGGGQDYGSSDLDGDAGGDTYDPTGNGDEPFDELPTELSGEGAGNETANVDTIVSTVSGGFGDYAFLAGGSPEPQQGNSLNAVITHTTYTDTPIGIFDAIATLTGTYSKPTDSALWRANLEGVGSDGGRAYGFIGGSWHSWDGVLTSIYIDPSGWTGQFFGILSGTNDEVAGRFEGSGTIDTIRRVQTNLRPADLLSSLITDDNNVNDVGCVIGDNGGTLTGQITITDINIENEDWGIWTGVFKGPYDNAEENAQWAGVMGTVRERDDYGYDYSFGTFEGIDGLNGSLRVDVRGISLNNYELGAFFGTMLGAYGGDVPYDYEAVGGGGSKNTRLTFSGVWGGDTGDTLYYNNNGSFGVAGNDAGYIGSVTPNWYNYQQLEEEEFPFIAMGTYDVGSRQAPYLWNTEFYSYNPYSRLYFTNDTRGTIYGYTTGLMNQNMMDGRIYGISYIPATSAGIFDDDYLIGSYYPVFGEGSGMWKITGEIDAPYPKATQSRLGSYDSANLSSFLDWGSLDADVDGTFGGVIDYLNMPDPRGPSDPYLTGTSDATSRTVFLHDSSNARTENWGIFNLKMTGPDSYYNPGSKDTFFAGINGDGDFGYSGYGNTASFVGGTGGICVDNEIEGKGYIEGYIGAIYIDDNRNAGFFEGGVYGLYNEDINNPYHGTWITSSIGRFQGMGQVPYSRAQLEDNIYQNTFSGGGTGDFEAGGSFNNISFRGMSMNITDEPWGLWAADFKGGFTGPTGGGHAGPEGPPIWKADISTTSSNSVTWATVEGYEWADDGRLWGDVWGYGFRKDDSNAQILWGQEIDGDAIGTYDTEDSTFDAVAMGEWREWAELDTVLLGFDFQDLNDFITVPITEAYWSDISGTGSFGAGGRLTGDMDVSFFSDAATPGNGIWAGTMHGEYTLPTSDNFNMILQGDAFSADNFNLVLHDEGISATLTGLQWSDYEWKARVVNGTGPDGIEFSGEAAGRYGDVNPDMGTGHFNGIGAGTYETNE